MPELPEVETTRRGIAPLVTGRRIEGVLVREPRLRWPVPENLARNVSGEVIESVGRRAKYLLLELPRGHVIVHLGMSGSLRVIDAATPARKHDHVDIVLDDGHCIRLHDPRRFGAVLWHAGPLESHALLRALGPEPLDDAFNAELLYRASRGRKVAVKNFIMDAHTVVGVGNIYASEALFTAGINPVRAAGRVAPARYEALAAAIKTTLEKAIGFGGTTLRDFADAGGRPGYFRHELNVYGRAGEDCPRCGEAIRQRRIGQRSSFYCASCQT